MIDENVPFAFYLNLFIYRLFRVLENNVLNN